MKNWRNKNKKIIFGVLTVAVVFVLGTGQIKIAQANWWGIDSIAAKAVGTAAGAMGYLFGFITSAIFWLGGMLIDFALNINTQILSENNAIIHTGWQIMLGFANLGFVLAIIVIAFATIFRMKNYAMEKTLGKLIAAALLVNFSLVIAGAIINVSDTFSEYLLTGAALKGEGNFSVALGQVLGTQTFLKIGEAGEKGDILKTLDAFGGGMLILICSIFFIGAFNLLSAIILLAIAAMLIIRYVTLGILLILSPMVWLCWIFPNTQQYWKKWWNEFIRWVFFMPVMLFFLYLTVQTSAGVKEYADAVAKREMNNPNSVMGVNPPMTLGIDSILNLVIVLGLMVGGLIAANSLGIKGAKEAYGFAQGAGKWARGAIGGKGLQYGSSLLRRKGIEPGAKSVADRMSEWSAKSRLTKIPLLRAVPGLAAKGIAKFSAAGGENLVQNAKGAASKRSLNENIAMLGYANAPTRQGILQHLQEKDLLDKVPNGIKYIDNKYKTEAARFGQGVGYNNIEKSLGMNVEMKKAFDDYGKESKQFSDAGKTFFSKFSEKDWSKPQYNDIYDSKPKHGASEELHIARQEIFVNTMSEINPGQLVKAMPKIKGENFDNYEKIVNETVTKMYETNPEKAKKVAESFAKALGRRMLGIELEIAESIEPAKPKEEKEEKKKA